MKKSQILSALALAMAIGAVAPVASVSAFKEPTSTAHGTATCADSKRAAKAIEANSRYAAAAGFRAAVKTAENTKTPANVQALQLTAANFDTAANNVIAAYKVLAPIASRNAGVYFTSAKMKANNYKIENYATDLVQADWTIENVKEVIDAAKATYGYDKVYKVWDAIERNDKAAFSAAISGYNQVMTLNVRNADTEWATTGAGMYTRAANVQADPVYRAFDTLFRAVDTLQNDYDAYAPNAKALKNAYNKMVSAELINSFGAFTYRDTIASVNLPKLEDIVNIVLEYGQVRPGLAAGNYSDFVFNDTNVASADELTNLEVIVVDGLKACNVDREDGVIYDTIIDAAYNYGRINGIKVASDSEKVSVAKTLVNYTAEEDNKDKDVTPTDAPNSGILGTAEGSATTVSIVAGLATSLTALGAGVVAYRNARRK